MCGMKMKLMKDEAIQTVTVMKTKTVVFANNSAPTRQISKFRKLRADAYKNDHQRPVGRPAAPSKINNPTTEYLTDYNNTVPRPYKHVLYILTHHLVQNCLPTLLQIQPCKERYLLCWRRKIEFQSTHQIRVPTFD